ELFYGSFNVDSATRQYRRVPGVRELITVYSGDSKIEVNEATPDVLAAIPAMTRPLAESIVKQRGEAKFATLDDLVKRVPEMFNSDALKYMVVTQSPVPTMIVSRGVIAASGASRTVRLLFKTEEKAQILLCMPLLY